MEQAIIFGKYDHLVGVENIIASDQGKNIAMILITAGMLNNVGPFRMYVDIAQELSEKGISSLRFDLSGIGESLGVGSTGKSIDRAADEVTEAMDYLSEKHGIEEFILYGLCSGADDSVQTALKDDRVKGVIALDGVGYKTLRFKLNCIPLFVKRMLKWEKWLNKIRNIMSSQIAPASLASGGDVREFPDTPEQACHDFQQLVDRGTQLHFIYTGGTDYYNYAQQFYDMLPGVNWKNTESTTFFPHMDHVVLLCEDRQELVDHIAEKTKQIILSSRIEQE